MPSHTLLSAIGAVISVRCRLGWSHTDFLKWCMHYFWCDMHRYLSDVLQIAPEMGMSSDFEIV
ncbi:unnamed protein product [Staurois parvus]|uniref:Uncharacterized protein n=1 Tax=Staurois parvus TaxID=386267 RepID=A0ABN9FME3_9NEOB|nr:unnamed protein product [Staurois parvus]